MLLCELSEFVENLVQVKTYTLDFWGGASPRGRLRAYRNGQTPSSAGRRQGKHRHPAPTRGYRFAAPRGAPALTESAAEIQRPRPCLRPWCPWYSKDAPVVIEIHPRSTGAPWEWQVRPVSNARMPGAPGIPRAHLASPGAPAIFTGAPGVIEVHLQSTGAPCEWQVRPVSNKRMPGAPGDLQVRLASPGAPDAYVISQGAPERQILNQWWFL